MSVLRAAAWLLLACPGALRAGEPPVSISTPYSISRDHAPGEHYMGVRLLGVLELGPATVDGHTLGGLSGLGFDRDEQRLYALNDRGVVFHLDVVYDRDGLLEQVRALGAHALLDGRSRPLAGLRSDSEGLTLRNAGNGVRGDTELVVSFERRPRVLRFTPRGELLGAVALPPALRDQDAYRHGNRGLEALAWHPFHGYLTAPEQPLRGAADGAVVLHALGSEMRWRYPLAPEPNAGLTDALVLEDGSLLTLERGYGVFFVPFITTLRRVARLPAHDGTVLAPQTVARFNTGQGWSLDNFEGLAQDGDGRILMVSDDNFRALQRTLLAAFTLSDTEASRPTPRTMKPVKERTPANALD